MEGKHLISSSSTGLFKIVFLLGIGCFCAGLIHILFASKTFPHFAHFPVHSGYSYPELIPLVFSLIVLEVLFIYKWRSKIALMSTIIWLLNFVLFSFLRIAGWPSATSSRTVVIGSLSVSFLCLVLSGLYRFNQKLFSKKRLLFSIAGYGSVFLSFVVSTRVFQALLLNSKLPLDKSYLSFNRDRVKESSTCRPLPNTIYSEKNVKSLIIVLDGFPVEELFASITGQPSKVHQYLKGESDIYNQSYTAVPYTPYSLAYLLAGIEPDPRCTYPKIDGSRTVRLAFGNQYFQTAGTVCNSAEYKINTFIRDIPHRILRIFGNNSNQSLSKIHAWDCSLMNVGRINSLLKWISSSPREANSIDIIHDVYFHDFGKTSSDYKKIDVSYFDSLNNLLPILLNSITSYDQVVIMSDHGPRTERFGKLLPGQTLAKNSMKFIDYYSTFYAIFKLNSHGKLLSWGDAVPKKIYYINEYFQPLRVFISE